MQCLSWMCATKCNYLFETSLRLTSSIRLGAIRRECVFLGINRLHSLGDNLAKAWLISIGGSWQDHVTQGGSMTLAISYLRDWTQFREYFETETWDAKWSYRQWFGIFLWPELKPSAKASGGSFSIETANFGCDDFAFPYPPPQCGCQLPLLSDKLEDSCQNCQNQYLPPTPYLKPDCTENPLNVDRVNTLWGYK